MLRSSWLFVILLGLGALSLTADVSDGGATLAPQQGSVYVQTSYPDGTRAPNIPLSVKKLSGNYPLPAGPFMTDRFGKTWVTLYPGVYRFRAKSKGALPKYIDVSVASKSENYIFFLLPLTRKPLEPIL
jgi:hypothetical protein